MKIGLLPLYIALYDVYSQGLRPRLEAFYEKVAEEIEKRGAEVVRSPFCRLKNEFEGAVSLFKKENVDAIVTLHMAYSPSLESIDALCKTDLPIVILDTTETLSFSATQTPSEISYNHGIHGVMDLCSLLKQRSKPYAIAAGHYLYSKCIDRDESRRWHLCKYKPRQGRISDVLASAQMLPVDLDRFTGAIRGWMRPKNSASTAEFLEKLSINGATHHSMFVYGAEIGELAYFARLLDLKCVTV